MKSLIEQLKSDEGFSGTIYRCSKGKRTVGYGRCLDTNPLTQSEALYLLQSDVDKIARKAARLGFYKYLSPARKNVIISMIYTMGFTRFKDFVKMASALYDSNYDKAADEMLLSKWHRELKDLGSDRAFRLSEIMRNGE